MVQFVCKNMKSVHKIIGSTAFYECFPSFKIMLLISCECLLDFNPSAKI